MALQIYQSPTDTADKIPALTNWTPIVGYVIYQSDTTVDSFFYYQIAIAIYQGEDQNRRITSNTKTKGEWL